MYCNCNTFVVNRSIMANKAVALDSWAKGWPIKQTGLRRNDWWVSLRVPARQQTSLSSIFETILLETRSKPWVWSQHYPDCVLLSFCKWKCHDDGQLVPKVALYKEKDQSGAIQNHFIQQNRHHKIQERLFLFLFLYFPLFSLSVRNCLAWAVIIMR